MAQNRLSQIKKLRLENIKKLRDLGIDPYPTTYPKKDTILESRKKEGKKVQTAGRIISLRGHGRILFADLMDETGQIQLFFQEKNLKKDGMKILSLVDTADFLGVKGQIIKTKAGEITIDVSDFSILSKALRPLPGKWHGLKDTEERFRKRYIDLLLDPAVRKRFQIRSDLVRHIRDYLYQKKYTEIETPTLQPLYGGTNAKPFKTHLNALSTDVYLRIADELYLKRAVIGGFERVFEICKDFRNEGMDQNHSPEFTMIEYYESYADYYRVMQVTEGLLKYCAKKIHGKEELTVQGKKISLAGTWPQITMIDALKKHLDLDVEKESQESLFKFAQKNKIEIAKDSPKGLLIFEIFDHLIPKKLTRPTWIIDYPSEVSPLSKAHPDKPGWVQRFEGYIGGIELCDGWSEVNDSQDQRARFENDKDREDAHPVDEDFITALEYGLPPLGGIGIGIDRLTMFFTDTWSIREVILFPLMKSKIAKKTKKNAHPKN
jgi:lysyl-tRNA synthetase, class II